MDGFGFWAWWVVWCGVVWCEVVDVTAERTVWRVKCCHGGRLYRTVQDCTGLYCTPRPSLAQYQLLSQQPRQPSKSALWKRFWRYLLWTSPLLSSHLLNSAVLRLAAPVVDTEGGDGGVRVPAPWWLQCLLAAGAPYWLGWRTQWVLCQRSLASPASLAELITVGVSQLV